MDACTRLAEMKAIVRSGYIDRTIPPSSQTCIECNHSTVYRISDGAEVYINPNTRTHPMCTRCMYCQLRATTDGKTIHYVLPEGVHYECGIWWETTDVFLNYRFYALDKQGTPTLMYPDPVNLPHR